MADELLDYTATRQGTTVKRSPEVRAENSVDGRVHDLIFKASQYRLAIEPEV
jgi:hypothetical protein